MKHTGDILWRGKPSQLSNFPTFVACFVMEVVIIGGSIYWKNHYGASSGDMLRLMHFTIFLIPVLLAARKWLEISFHSYELTSERFMETMGILNKVTYGAELYLVQDTMCSEPLFLRFLGLGNVVLYTTDVTSPVIIIRAIPNVSGFHSKIRSLIESAKDKKNIMLTV